MKASEFLDREISLAQSQISELQTRLRGLQSRRNALAPLCRLPPEILVHIMDGLAAYRTEAIKASAVNGKPSEKRRELAGWTHAMGVCTHMRALVLNTPSLWTEVDLNGSSEWVNLCTQRSSSSPLTLSFNEDVVPWPGCECTRGDESRYSDEKLSSLSHAFKEYLPRASHADIHLNTPFDLAQDVENVFCGTPFPHLRSLAYVVDDCWDDVDSFLYDSANFLAGAPNLTHLVLHGLQISIDSLTFPRLVHLEMNDVTIMERPEAVFGLVSRSPLLQELHLGVGYRYVETSSDFCTPSVHLPHLRSLSIGTARTLALTHLLALPIPKDRLHVHPGGVVRHNPTPLPDELFNHLWSLLDSTHSMPMVKLESTRTQDLVCIELAHAGMHVASVVYESSSSLIHLRAILNRMHSIHVSATGFGDTIGVLEQAATDPLHELAAVERIVVSTACFDRTRHGLCLWLRSRVDVGRRVRSINLCGCANAPATCPDAHAELQKLQNLAKELKEAGLAEEILVEGNSLTE
jgi:hypothetical protein